MTISDELRAIGSDLHNSGDALAGIATSVDALAAERDGLAANVTTLQQKVIDLQAQLDARPSPTPSASTVFSVDLAQFSGETGTWASRVAAHKQMLGVPGLQNVRIFFSPGEEPDWRDSQFAALTENDSVLISFKDALTEAEFSAIVAATPAKFRKRKGQVKWCYHHECEAEWAAATDRTKWISTYLGQYAMMARVLLTVGIPTTSPNDVVKIMLWYSQNIDTATKGSWRTFYGGQNFGQFGMDCYHYQGWLNKKDGSGRPAGRYATPDELFGLLLTVAAETGLPVCAPEWGGTLANNDPDGTGRAKAIADGGAYAKKNGLTFVNWWCALGSANPDGTRRVHHVDPYPSNVAALKALVVG